MGSGQGNRAAPPSWIQFNSVLVNVFKQLNLGALIQDPITAEIIHSMGTLFVDDTDLYMWRKEILDPGNLWCQTQLELEQWSCLLNATEGALKPEKCFWYMLDYKRMQGRRIDICRNGAKGACNHQPQRNKKPNPAGGRHSVKEDTGNTQFSCQR